MGYRIQSGDTLSAIASRFHTSVTALAKANGIRNPSLIHTGDVLRIPGKSDSFHPAKKKHHVTQPPASHSTLSGKFGHNAAHLAKVAERVARRMNTRGWCARGVFDSLQAAGLGIPRSGSAYMAARTLAHDHRFREVRLTDAQIRKLPAGAIVVSGPYNMRGNPYGHIAVTLGHGREASDHVSSFVGTVGTQRVFIPIG